MAGPTKENHNDGLAKRIAKPHRYFAVTKAVGSTVQAAESNGEAGVVWHTHGSGKSMEMELYTPPGRPATQTEEPTIVVSPTAKNSTRNTTKPSTAHGCSPSPS
jgi:type I restriction enzyme, R subunit